MICRAGEHYTVIRAHDRVSKLVCARCPFTVHRDQVSGANAPEWTGGKSGLPRYNRMRAVMVKHIHAEHAERGTAFARGDVVIEIGASGGSLGIVLQSGAVAFDIIWLGGSTSRYRYATGRAVRLATEDEIAADPFTIRMLRQEAEAANEERRTGAGRRRAGGPN